MALTAKPKRSHKTHDKRRVGAHHKRNEHYLKPYWPYLPLALVVAAGILANTVLNMRMHGVLGYATDMSVSNLLTETNGQRSGNGLGALALNSQLNQAAQAKANDMAARDYWAHVTPDGQQPWAFFTAAGYQYQTAGENLAYGFDTSTDAVTAWMNSPEHRDNILNTTYKDVGFGIANSPNYQGTGPETIVVAEYGSLQITAAPVASAPAASTPAPTPAPAPAPTAQQPTTQPAPEANATPAPATNDKKAVAAVKPVTTQPITRIQLLANNQAAPWSVFAVSVIATAALAIFLLRHGLAWHRVLVKSEKFILKHKLLDIILVSVAVVGVILTRTVGVIR